MRTLLQTIAIAAVVVLLAVICYRLGQINDCMHHGFAC